MEHIQQEHIIAAAQAGGEVIAGYFGQALDIQEKSRASDFRTVADTDAEQAILKQLTHHYPNINIYAEESGITDHGSPLTFVIDPLDGSNNFMLNIPNFSSSIALMLGDRTILGVVHNPMLGHTYWARENGGAYLRQGSGADMRETRLSVNREAAMGRATIALACGYHVPTTFDETVARQLNNQDVKRLTRQWSPAYDHCLLAAGRIEGIINEQSDVYDYAAGKLIAREAGARITGYDGQPAPDTHNQFVASNGTALHDALLQAVTL